MPETLHTPINLSKPIQSLGQEPTLYSVDKLEESRIKLANSLIEHGLMSREFIESGVLDRFDIDPKTGHESFTHILIGDRDGGAHHLRTILDLGIAGRMVASAVIDPRPLNRSYDSLKDEQRLNSKGTYKAIVVDIKDDGYHKDKRLEGGSTMFPDAWSAEEVIKAVVKVSQIEPIKHDEKRKSNSHLGVVDGVKIRVITDEKTGKIITASPKRRK